MTTLPQPLPLEPDVERLVFTHKSLRVGPASSGIEDVEEPRDWERVAFLGEGVLFAAISNVMYRAYPRHRTSYLKPTRVQLLSKESLAGVTDYYGWMAKIRCLENSRPNIIRSLDNRAALAESYVGGLALQYGVQAACNWAEEMLISKHNLPTTSKVKDEVVKAVPGAGTPDVPKGVPTPSTLGMGLAQKAIPSQEEAKVAPTTSTAFHQAAATTSFPPNPGQESSSFTILQSKPAIPATETKPSSTLVRKPSFEFQKPKDSINDPTPPPLSDAYPQKPIPSPTPIPAPSPSKPVPKALTFGALAKLNENATRRCQKVEWDFSSDGQGQFISWKARLILRGSVVSEGLGQSKQIAKELAAQQALDTMGWKSSKREQFQSQPYPLLISPSMPLPVSKKKVGLGRAIANKRAKDALKAKESGRYTTDIPQEAASRLQSVTQERDLDEFLNTAELAATDFTAEKQNVKIIHAPTVGSTANPYLLSSQEEKDVLRKQWENRTRLRVPRRPPWTKTMTPGQLDRQEKTAIVEWRRNLAHLQEKENFLLTPFERNLEVWRQLWRVLERSQLIVQIVDARNPLKFRCEDLEQYVQDVEGPEGEKGTGRGLRKSLLLINKSDLLTQAQRRQWADYFDEQGIQYAFFSALDAKALQEARAAAEEAAAAKEAPTHNDEHSADEGEVKTTNRMAALGVDDDGSPAEDEEDEDEAEESESEDDSSEPAEEESDDESTGRYVPRPRDENEDPRTRVLSVLELEELFLKSAPDRSKFADAQGNLPQKTVVGLVGYPNVGKSSTINALLGEKKVSVSSTPGKTKHFQTIHLSPSILLCDCPGLVFPQFATTKAELICDGVLPIDQMREYSAPIAVLTKRIPPEILDATYGLSIKRKTQDEGGDGRTITEWDFLAAYAIARGFTRASVGNPDEARAARYILKDYVNGKLLYCHPPPSATPEEFNAASNVEVLARLLELRKKKAPTTRVTKNADTYIAQDPSAIQTHTSQGARSKRLDDGFFEAQAAMSARPFVQGTTRDGLPISRVKLYPHQNLLADDGTEIGQKNARVASIVQQAGNDAVSGKKRHFKPKKVKLRKQFATVGYD